MNGCPNCDNRRNQTWPGIFGPPVKRERNHRMKESGLNAPRSNEGAIAAVEFSADLKEFNKAVKYLLAGTSRTEQDRLEFVDVNAQAPEVELVTSGVSSPFPADVRTSGYARIPLLVFERISRAIGTFRKESIRVLIKAGKMKVENSVFSHGEISLRLIGSRIADVPIGAPLPDVLGVLTRFRPEEIEDSGLLARVLAAQERSQID